MLIENVFIRSDDDSIAVKGQYPSVDTANLLVRDSVLWNQRFGNCMEIGFELFNAAIHNRTYNRVQYVLVVRVLLTGFLKAKHCDRCSVFARNLCRPVFPAHADTHRASLTTNAAFACCVVAVTFERNVCLHQSGSIMSIHNGGHANVHDVHYKVHAPINT